MHGVMCMTWAGTAALPSEVPTCCASAGWHATPGCTSPRSWLREHQTLVCIPVALLRCLKDGVPVEPQPRLD